MQASHMLLDSLWWAGLSSGKITSLPATGFQLFQNYRAGPFQQEPVADCMLVTCLCNSWFSYGLMTVDNTLYILKEIYALSGIFNTAHEEIRPLTLGVLIIMSCLHNINYYDLFLPGTRLWREILI